MVLNRKSYTAIFRILFLSILVLNTGLLDAQKHYTGVFVVSFTDKDQSPYSIDIPADYLSGKAIERRQEAGIAIIEQDLPVNQFYIDSVMNYDGIVHFASRWLNAVLVEVDDSLDYLAIENLGFVDSLQYLAPYLNKSKKKSRSPKLQRVNTVSKQASLEVNHGESYNQLDLIGVTSLHNLGFYGEEVQIAVFDNGFSGVDKLEAFDVLFNGQLLGTKSFVNPNNSVFKMGSHGTYVLSTMAAFESDKYIGSAPGASYWLIHTEDTQYEYPIEEYYWLVAAEFCDSAGVDIISSSLVYTLFDDPLLNHTHSQLNGRTSIISRAAQTATEKGVLVFNSVGNDAQNPWQRIAFPSDAVDVVSVGATNMKGEYASFSSVGNSTDGRIKPTVSAVGEDAKALSPNTGQVVEVNGTSYSTPTIAGAAAVLWQANPNASAEEIKNAIEQSSSQYYHPDSLLGYGVPDFYLAHILLNNESIDAISSEKGFLLMPNPCIDELYVLFHTVDSQMVDIQIYDLTGKLIWEENNVLHNQGLNVKSIDGAIEELSAGMYIVVLIIDGDKFSQKLVK